MVDIISEIRKGFNELADKEEAGKTTNLKDACQVIVKAFDLVQSSDPDPVRKEVAKMAADTVSDAASFIES